MMTTSASSSDSSVLTTPPSHMEDAEELFEDDDDDYYEEEMDVVEHDDEDFETYHSSSTSQDNCNITSLEELVGDTGHSHEEDDNNSEYVVWGNVRRRKPKRIKRYVLAPRVIKSDIRRKYNTMFSNCLNGYDINLLKSFFTTFGVNQEQFSYHLYVKPVANTDTIQLASSSSSSPPLPIPIDNLRCDMKINGVEAFLWFIGGIQFLSPDRTVRYSNIKVHTFSNSAKSFIESDFYVEGNVLYNVKILELVKLAFGLEDDKNKCSTSAGVVASSKKASKRKLAEVDNTITSPSPAIPSLTIPTALESVFPKIDAKEIMPFLEANLQRGNMPRFPKPVESRLTGKLMIFLDEHRRVERIAQISEA